MPRVRGASGSVRAKTMKTSASGALVMYRLAPLITHSSPSRCALVVRVEGSEPASASVSANDARTSPEAILGSQSAFCSSVPPTIRTCPAMPLFVPNMERRAGVVYPSSNINWASSYIDSPSPPYSSGSAKPNRPIFLAASRISAGISSFSSISASSGTTRSRTKRRTSDSTALKSAASMSTPLLP